MASAALPPHLPKAKLEFYQRSRNSGKAFAACAQNRSEDCYTANVIIV